MEPMSVPPSLRAFPWVLEVFAVSAYHFYRLIELVIKVEGSFPRSIIKHLNRVGCSPQHLHAQVEVAVLVYCISLVPEASPPSALLHTVCTEYGSVAAYKGVIEYGEQPETGLATGSSVKAAVTTLPAQVEEMVLGHLAWKSDSPLFEAIEAAGSVPTYEDVALPTPSPGSRASGSPVLHPRRKALGGKGMTRVGV